MGHMQKVTRRRLTPRPDVVNDGATRGQMFKHLLDTAGMTVTAFSEVSGIPRNTVQRWLSGSTDLANIDSDNSHALVQTLGRSNDEAHALFGIPEDRRATWGRRDMQLPTITGELLHLHTPLYGEINMPANATVRYAKGGQGEYQLVRLSDGTYYAVRSLVDLRDAEVLGVLLGVSFGAPQSTPTPAAAEGQN